MSLIEMWYLIITLVDGNTVAEKRALSFQSIYSFDVGFLHVLVNTIKASTHIKIDANIFKSKKTFFSVFTCNIEFIP